jgi:hypothetical protein
MRVLLDSGCGGTLVNRSFVKKVSKTDLEQVHELDYQGGHSPVKSQASLPYPNFIRART